MEDESPFGGLLMKSEKSSRKTVSIEKVSNGFIITSNSNGMGFDEKRAIAKDRKEARKMASKFLS